MGAGDSYGLDNQNRAGDSYELDNQNRAGDSYELVTCALTTRVGPVTPTR
jgi:hypothetical protein